MNQAFMTSTIGDLTIDSNGLRTAIDEIKRLQNIIKQEMKKSTLLRIQYKNSTDVKEISIARAFTIKTDTTEILYYETFGDEPGDGTKIDLATVCAWEIKGTEPCGGGALLRL